MSIERQAAARPGSRLYMVEITTRYRRSAAYCLPISGKRLTPCLVMPSVAGMRQRKFHGPAARAIREATGVSISAFAPRVDVTQGYMSNVELGHKQPTVEFMARVARELGVPLDAISYTCATCAAAEAVVA